MPASTENLKARSRRPLIVAHRGASGLAPENTLAAFRLALAMKADGIELDTHLSADGEIMVIHDARINRTTNGAGAVARLDRFELEACDAGSWFERKLARRPRIRAMAEEAAKRTGRRHLRFAGERVPTLREVLALAAAASVKRVYIELKGERRKDKQPLLEGVLSLIAELRMEPAVTLLSFDHDIIKRAKAAAPRLRTAATFALPGRGHLTGRAIIKAVEDAGADEAALHYALAARRTVAALHDRGISVAAWTVNRRTTMRRMLSAGVDSIMTNYPNRLAELLESENGEALRSGE